MMWEKLGSRPPSMTVSVLVSLVGLITLECTSFANSNALQLTPGKHSANINTPRKDIPATKSENSSTINTQNQDTKVSMVNSPDAAEVVGLQQDMPYKEARKILIQQGWQPNLTINLSDLEDRTS